MPAPAARCWIAGSPPHVTVHNLGNSKRFCPVRDLGSPWINRQARTAAHAQKPSSDERAGSSSSATTSSGNGQQAKVPDSAYPSRDFASGGWAGGEVGLREFLESSPAPAKEKAKKEGREAPSNGASSSGKRVSDNPERYPSKQSIGPLEGITGGFAGGERGVQQFVEEGDIKFSDTGNSQYSPLIVALVVSVGVTAAAVLLNSEVEYGEKVLGLVSLPTKVTNININPGSVPEPLLQAALIAAALGVLVLGSRTLARKVGEGRDRVTQLVLSSGRLIVFWLGVFVAIKVILDST